MVKVSFLPSLPTFRTIFFLGCNIFYLIKDIDNILSGLDTSQNLDKAILLCMVGHTTR